LLLLLLLLLLFGQVEDKLVISEATKVEYFCHVPTPMVIRCLIG